MARSLDPTKVGPRTLAIHAGERPDPATRASAPPIVMSSTFVSDTPMGFSAHDLGEDSPFVYSRWANPTVRALETKMAALEGAEAAACFGSGMAAASAILFSKLSAGDHLALADVCYAGVAEFARETLPRMGVEISTFDGADLDSLRGAMRPNTKLVFVDTPTNPLMKLTDIAAAAEIAHAGGAALAVDNTFASPMGTNPIRLGADYAMHSLTKYVGGHGDAVGGVVCASAERAKRLTTEAVIHYGGVLSPFNAWLILRGAATLPLRMRAHEEGATAVARWLESHPRVERVLYPGLESHPQRDLAKRQMACASGMLTFRPKGGLAEGRALAERMTASLGVIHYAVSLGHHRSLVVWMETEALLQSTFRLPPEGEARYREWAGDGVFRLSVGLEDADDLIRDLDTVL